MHKSTLLRMEWFVHNFLAERQGPMKVLDVGSYDVNGSYKHLFNGQQYQYTGLDMVAGQNVDIVPQCPYIWEEIEKESFDVVISGQVFEHVEFPWITISEIARVLKNNGLLCIIVPRLQGRHRYPVDTYRYDVDGVIALARYAGLKPLHASMNQGPKGCPPEWYSESGDTMLIACKPSTWIGCMDIESVKSYICFPSDLDELSIGFFDYKSSFPAYVEKRIIIFARSIRRRLEYFSKLGAAKGLPLW